jgi:hypothetical protein
VGNIGKDAAISDDPEEKEAVGSRISMQNIRQGRSLEPPAGYFQSNGGCYPAKQ